MSTAQTPTDDRVTVRLGKLSKQLQGTAKRTGQKESEIMRAALAHFFATYPTASDVIRGVIEQRSKEAAA
jgi:predicted transcriptional regulator